jgi:hypothetical protein
MDHQKPRELILNIDDFISVVDYDNQIGLFTPPVSLRIFKIKDFLAIRRNKGQILDWIVQDIADKLKGENGI